MANYTAIADISERLLSVMKQELVPEVLKNEDEIGLRSPEDRGDVSLGLFLYDIQESGELRQNSMINSRVNRQEYPPAYLNLYYMLTAYSAGDLKFRMVQEERILGGVVQLFHNNALIRATEEADNGGMDLHVQLLSIPPEEKARIWSFPGVPYRLSLYYKISPVVIESGRQRDITRVTKMDISVKPETEPGRRRGG